MNTYKAPASLLSNKVILVTGAGDGIGKEAALTFARYGATVILLGKTTSKLTAVYDEICTKGGSEPAIIPLDLKGASQKNYQDMAASIESEFGRLDGILHNAGILGGLAPFEHIKQDIWNDILQVNLTGPMLLTQALLPVLRKADHGSIVFTSSGVGRQGKAYWGGYAVSKFATEGLMQTLADEFSESSIRVNCINPGATRTTMRARAYPAENSQLLKTPADLMWLYLYLMGDDSLEINGQSLDAQPKP
ncbi:YciK family oxidoreductase [Alkalimonas collagenimarina]|uniref:YciK family oxidoreductase n=1 Tax=Alkalimonas collagenimarina TaxID=400390 RepID=A0ABT9H350_9GAMM|nr:YciK family oxidoreductase [Alkalimonas collagenimarina]MDP4537722.1 YciK family oxidoreductase [Alkalimonas collagenimarina]